jgi:predicted Zn-dependent peptidase
MDVAQGKLCMGLRTGCSVADESYPALMLLNAVYGGTATSKLFLNVREKLSLCYYASSSLEKHKGLMIVSSGVEFKNFEAARDEILRQLDAVRNGEIEERELEAGRRAMIGALRAVMDSQAQLEDFYLGQAAAELSYGPEELALLLEDITKDQVVEAAGKIRLDAVYFLEGQNREAEHEEAAL